MILPPLASLRSFEAAARLGSFKAAALELGVTKSAITYHVQALERFVKCPLFIRKARQVTLTGAGLRLQAVTENAFGVLSAGIAEISDRGAEETITIKVGPYFSGRWLSPRLSEFSRRHPEIQVILHHALVRRIQSDLDCDLAILWGDGAWAKCEADLLLPVQAVAVCSRAYKNERPDLARRIGQGSAEISYLHYEGEDAWQEWLQAVNPAAESPPLAAVYDDPNVLYRSAVAGQGVAIGYLPLIEPDLRAKRLVLAHPKKVVSGRGFYFVRHRGANLSRGGQMLKTWLHDQAADRRTLATGIGYPPIET